MKREDPIRFVFLAHHKVASSWLHRLLWNLMCDAGVEYRVYNKIDRQARGEIERLIENSSGPLAFGISNSIPEDLSLFTGFTGLHVVRDPREMVVSGYYSHRDSHKMFPELKEERKRLRAASLDEGLRIVMTGLMKSTFQSLQRWPDRDTVREIRFEDFTRDYEVLWDFVKWAGYDTTKGQLTAWPRRCWNQFVRRSKWSKVLWQSSGITRKSFDLHLARLDWKVNRERAIAEKTGTGHYRPKDKKLWHELFDRETEEYFESLFPGLVKRLGYEGRP